VFLFIYLIFNFRTKIQLLNIVSFIFILLFCIYKQCVLTIINNNITNRFTIWKGSYDRLYYFFDLNRPYINNTIYTLDDYNQLYQDYLKAGGGPLNGFTKENLDKIIVSLQEQQ
jgi:hypothetical protein